MHICLLLGVDPFILFDSFLHFPHLLLDSEDLIIFSGDLFLLPLNDSLQVTQLSGEIVNAREQVLLTCTERLHVFLQSGVQLLEG